MDGGDTINKTDFFLREIPNVKISRDNYHLKKTVVKEELQLLRLNEGIQEKIMETLKYIHGPEFKLEDVSAYEEETSNLLKKYWVGRGSLVVKGGFDFSQSKDEPTDESDILKQFGLMRLESYGFHKNHCIEAFNYCRGDINDCLYLLYLKYFNWDGTQKEIDHGISENDLLEQRVDERSSLESIYENSFKAKTNSVWILTMKLEYLISIFHKKEIIKPEISNQPKKEKCRNLLRGNCKFGNKCRFSHEIEKVIPNAHLDNYSFDLEIRFPHNTKYPYEPPLIFLKTNAVLPPLLNLHICKRLYEEAKLLAEDGIPCVYRIAELLQNEEAIKQHLKEDVDFLKHNQKLFDRRDPRKERTIRPSHYEKGITNRDGENDNH